MKINNISNKKYLIYLIYIPIIINFLLNLKNNFSVEKIYELNYFDYLSTLFLFIFICLIGEILKKTFDFKYISTGIVVYLLSFFFFDNLILFLYKEFTFKNLFLTINILWILIVLLRLKSIYKILLTISSYLFINIFNKFTLNNLTLDKNIIGDVKDIHYTHVENIYEINYFYSMNNATLEGYPQLSAYIQALFNLMLTNSESFVHTSASINLLLFLFYLLFAEVSLSKNSKIAYVLLFTALIFNSQWYKFVFVDSLMTEGVLSYLFIVLLISCIDNENLTTEGLSIVFFAFGILFLSKQFISTLSLISIILISFKVKKWKYTLLGISGLVLKELSFLTYFSNIQKNYHLKDVDLIDTFFDILFIRDLEFKNIPLIIKNLFVDVPLSILIAYFLILALIYIFFDKNKNFELSVLIFIIFLNFIFIFTLYITLWKTMELESPIRYMLNLLPTILYFQFKYIDYKFQNI